MTIATRRFLYIAFILAFSIITPWVISYAAGYQLSFSLSKPLQFQKTGMLILNSSPDQAMIYLNGNIQQIFSKKYFGKIFGSNQSYILTPAKIKNLLPGEYDVRLEKDGYWLWQKKLTVKGGESTYAEDVYLFKNNLPFLIADGEVKNSLLTSDGKRLITLTIDNLFITNTSDDTTKKIALKITADNFSLSPDEKRLIIGNFVYDIDGDAEPISLAGSVGQDALNFQWNKTANDKIIYISSSNNGSQNTLKEVNLTDLSIRHIIATEKIENYFIKDGIIYIINAIGNQKRIYIYDSEHVRLTDFELSKSDDYSFINSNNNLINLFNNRQKTLYLINPKNKFQIEEIINNVSFASWINNNKLLYGNDFEIWIYDMQYNQKSLLTRVSSSIQKAMLHPSDNYIIFVTENTIKTIELDDREKRNITELFKLEKISNPQLNSTGDMLYFGGKIGNQEGLYKLSIQ